MREREEERTRLGLFVLTSGPIRKECSVFKCSPLRSSSRAVRGGGVPQPRPRGEDAASGRVASLAAYCTVTRDGEGEGVQ